jgi:molybdopterin synthase catalytic subunit
MKITLTGDKLASDFSMDPCHGAGIVFHGVVRASEAGLPITGIDYSCYHSMANHSLRKMADQARRLFGNHDGSITHRIGFVAVGESAITIRVRSERSGRAFDACQWYLRRIKEDVPIWKSPVFL